MAKKSQRHQSALTRAGELGVKGRHKMGLGRLLEAINARQEELQAEGPRQARVVQRCSECGSTAIHHLDYIRQYGLCVV